MKKIELMALTMLLGMCVNAATEVVDGITWRYVISQQKATVGDWATYTTAVPGNSAGAIVIPSSLGGCPVTGLGEYSFWGCDAMTSVEMPPSVTSIGERSFNGCAALESVSISPNVLNIGAGAFWGCQALKAVEIPSGLASIGDHVFRGCHGLTAVEIPIGVSDIGEYAFAYCSGLESVKFPSTVTCVKSNAFDNCSRLTKVIVEKGDADRVRNLLAASGFDASGVQFVEIASNGDYTEKFGGYTWHYCVSGGVAVVRAYANGDRAVTPAPNGKLKVPAYLGGCPVVGIDDYALQKDWNDEANWHLTEVEFPVSISYIGQHAFESCNELSKITIPEGVSNLVIGDNAFNGCVLMSVELPEGVVSIGNFAFSTQYKSDGNGFTLSGTIILPSTLKAIGYGAFSTNRVDRVEFKGALPKLLPTPEGWTWLTPSYYGAFITHPDGTMPTVAYHSTYRESWQPALDECSPWVTFEVIDDPSLQTHTVTFDLGEHGSRTGGGELSQTVAHGGAAVAPVVTPDAGWMFEGWDSVFSCVTNNMTVSAKYQVLAKPDGGPYTEDVNGVTWVYVVTNGEASVENRGSAAVTNATSGALTVPPTLGGHPVTHIGDNAFYYCNRIRSVAIPEGVKSIGKRAFFYCTDLESVSVPLSVVEIGDFAFYGCSWLQAVNVPEGVIRLADGVFWGCARLTSLTIPSTVTSIGDETFANCTGLKSIDIPGGVTNIGSYAFSQCRGLTSVTIPPTIVDIGAYAFNGCNGLGEGVVVIDGCVLTCVGDCPTSVDLPQGVRIIAGGAFSSCGDLESIRIPEGVVRIGDNAFHGCNGLMSLALPSSLTSIGKWAFYSCTGLKSLVFPSGVVRIESCAFIECRGVVSVTIPSSVTTIGEAAFSNCSELKTVYVERGDVDRVKALLDASGFYTSKLQFCELGVPVVIDNDLSGKDWYVGDTYEYGIQTPVTEGGTQLVLAAWSVWNHTNLNVIASGTNSTVRFELANEGPYGIDFDWAKDYWLEIVASSNGTITGAGSGWCAADSMVVLTPVADAGHSFLRWTGDTEGCVETNGVLLVQMTRARRIGAEFSRVTHAVTFDLGEHGTRTGGGELSQTVARGGAAVAPVVTADTGWTFDGWDKDFSAVTADLTVTAKWSSAEAPHQKPDWTAPINLENWQVIYAKIYDRSSKTCLAHEEALLGAFDSSGNCIGHATIIPSLSLFQVNAGFDGGSISGVSLKYWDPERGEVEIRESLTLESGVNIGTISSPRIFDVGFIDMEIPLNQNFSWISIPLVLDDPSISTVFADCGLTDGDKVSAPGCSATLYGGKWYSSPETFVVKPGETYVVRKSSSGASKLSVSGSPMNATATAVSGWNWVGCMSVTNVPVTSLVHSAGFADDDSITGQGAGNVSSYLEGNWYGMNTLNCGVGYKIKVANPGSLSYGSVVSGHKSMMLMAKSPKVLMALGVESVTSNWVPLLNKQNWQTIYGRVNAPSGSSCLGTSGAKLAAFDSEGNCIGCCDFHEELSMFMLNVGFDGASISAVTLKYWDSTRGIIDIDAKVTIKDGEDIGSIPNAEVYNCIVEDPIPELPSNPTSADVYEALDGSVDAHLQECITEPTEYNAYRQWAETVKAPGGSTAAGAQAVKDSPNAWLSFALDSATLIQTPPADGDVKVEKFEQTAKAGSFDFTVGVENIPVGDAATPSNLAKVFGIEGGSTLSPQDMSSDKVDITFGTPENGKVEFTAGPKDKTLPTFFMKVKIK